MPTFYNTKPCKRRTRRHRDSTLYPDHRFVVPEIQSDISGLLPIFLTTTRKSRTRRHRDITPYINAEPFSVVAPGFWTPPTNYPLREELNALIELVDSVRVDLLQTSMIVNHIQDFMISSSSDFFITKDRTKRLSAKYT